MSDVDLEATKTLKLRNWLEEHKITLHVQNTNSSFRGFFFYCNIKIFLYLSLSSVFIKQKYASQIHPFKFFNDSKLSLVIS